MGACVLGGARARGHHEDVHGAVLAGCARVAAAAPAGIGSGGDCEPSHGWLHGSRGPPNSGHAEAFARVMAVGQVAAACLLTPLGMAWIDERQARRSTHCLLACLLPCAASEDEEPDVNPLPFLGRLIQQLQQPAQQQQHRQRRPAAQEAQRAQQRQPVVTKSGTKTGPKSDAAKPVRGCLCGVPMNMAASDLARVQAKPPY